MNLFSQSHKKDHSSSHLLPFGWIISTLILLLFIFLLQAYNLYRKSAESTKLIFHTNEVLKNSGDLQTHLESIKAANRGYLVTGDSSFLDEHSAAVDSALESLANLLALTRDNPVQQQRLQQLSQLLAKRVEISNRLLKSMDPRLTRKLPPEVLAVNRSLQLQLSSFQQTEKDLLQRRSEKNEFNSRGRLVFTVSTFFVLVIVLAFSINKIRQHIRRREAAEERAGANEEKYMSLVEDSGFATLIVDDRLQIQFASRPIEELSGYKPDELKGQTFTNYIPADYQGQINEIVSGIAQSGDFRKSHELKILTKNGGSKWVSGRMFPVTGKNGSVREWQIVLWDINEEKKMKMEMELLEAEAREQQKLVQDIIDNIPMIVFIKDVKGRYRIINKKMAELLHQPASNVIGKTDNQLSMSQGHLEMYRKTDEQVLTKKATVSIEDQYETEDGIRYFWVTKLPLLNEAGNVKYICGVAADVSAFKEVEHNLIKAKEEAEQAKSAQETFLANMSHEIRTPMNGIIGMTNLLSETSLSKVQQEYAESIIESAHSLVKLINDLLDISKIRSGKFQLESIGFSLRKVVKKVIYPLQFKASEKGISLKTEFDASLPEILIGDPLRLQQIIINLANNAIKFTAEGSVTIGFGSSPTQAGEVLLKVVVTDTGIGIPEDKVNDIFEIYTQSSDATARLYGGTGLGLSIVKQLVELQSGTISVSSIHGKGSVFTIEIPYRAGVLTAPVADDNLQEHYSEVLNGLSILVAEDNLINQKVVLFTLEKHGAKVSIVSNGREAVEQLRHRSFDLVLMDIQMPEMDGYDATRYIRQELKSDIPVIAMTANALKGEAEKCYEAGATGYISKPFDQVVLYNMIAEFTQTKKTNSIGMVSNANDDQLVDFSYIMELSDGRADYIHQVLSIFMENTPAGLKELEQLVREAKDWDAISKKAHFLKSSVGIVKIRGLHERLQEIETLAREQKGMETIDRMLSEILVTFSKAEQIILEKMDAAAQG